MIKKIIISIVLVIIVFVIYQAFFKPIKIDVILSTETAPGNEENLYIRFYVNKHSRIELRKAQYLIHNPRIKKTEIIRIYYKLSNRKDNYFRIVPSTKIQAAVPGRYYNDKNIKKIVFVTSINKAHTNSYMKIIAKHFKGKSVQIPFTANKNTYNKIFATVYTINQNGNNPSKLINFSGKC